MLRLATARRLQPEPLANEIAAQLRKFIDVFGRPPDFLDGHQHIQLFPQVRDAFLKVVAERAPDGMGQAVRTPAPRTAAAGSQGAGARHSKSWLPAQGRKLGIAVNPAFAGSYAFKSRANYARLFPRFLSGLPDGGLIMCHPGVVDTELKGLDSLTTLREQEFAFFGSDAFLQVLAEHNVALARPH